MTVQGLPAVVYPADPAIHDRGDAASGSYWACEQPERPTTAATMWSPDCHACLVHLATTLNCQPELRKRKVGYQASRDAPFVMVDLADSVAVVAEDRWADPIIVKLAASYGGDPDRIRRR